MSQDDFDLRARDSAAFHAMADRLRALADTTIFPSSREHYLHLASIHDELADQAASAERLNPND